MIAYGEFTADDLIRHSVNHDDFLKVQYEKDD